MDELEPQASHVPDKLAYLKMVHLFDGLTETEMKTCEREFPMVQAERGRIVLTPSDSQHALYIIKKGAVRLYRLARDGREMTIGNLEAGDVFGILPLFANLSRNAFAEATAETLLCIMREHHLQALIADHPEIATRLLRIVSERLASAEDQIDHIAFRSAEQRILFSLARMADLEGVP